MGPSLMDNTIFLAMASVILPFLICFLNTHLKQHSIVTMSFLGILSSDINLCCLIHSIFYYPLLSVYCLSMVAKGAVIKQGQPLKNDIAYFAIFSSSRCNKYCMVFIKQYITVDYHSSMMGIFGLGTFIFFTVLFQNVSVDSSE